MQFIAKTLDLTGCQWEFYFDGMFPLFAPPFNLYRIFFEMQPVFFLPPTV